MKKRDLRKEVFMFMQEKGHKLDLNSKISYGIVNSLIASFYESKENSLYTFISEAEEFWDETPDLIVVENDGVKLWTDDNSNFKLEKNKKYMIKIIEV